MDEHAKELDSRDGIRQGVARVLVRKRILSSLASDATACHTFCRA